MTVRFFFHSFSFHSFSFLFSFSQIQAQTPIYDECSTAIQLGIAPSGTCTTTEYTNVDATLSTGLFSTPADNIPTCWGSVDHDVWFEFQTPMDGSFVDKNNSSIKSAII